MVEALDCFENGRPQDDARGDGQNGPDSPQDYASRRERMVRATSPSAATFHNSSSASL